MEVFFKKSLYLEENLADKLNREFKEGVDVAEEAKVPSGPGENPNKGLKGMIIIFSFAFLITVIIASTVLIIFLKEKESQEAKNKTKTEHKKDQKKEAHKKKELGIIVDIGDEVIVNVKSTDENPHYLKIKVSLEVKEIHHGKDKKDSGGGHGGGHGGGGATVEEIEKRKPQIRDLLIRILTTKMKEEIEEKAGKDRIRKEMITEANKFLTTVKIQNVFFEEFLIQ